MTTLELLVTNLNGKWCNPDFTCEVCGKPNKTKQNLQIHKTSHSTEKVHPCSSCEKAFKAPHLLKWHIRNLHDKKEYVTCKVCSKTYDTRSFKGHKKEHEEREFSCDLCSYKCSVSKLLHAHKKTHFKHLLCSCDTCGKTFYQNSLLKNHIKRMHTSGMKDKKCYGCDFASIHKSKLMSHIKQVHTQERPFKCDNCDKSFKRRPHLKEHSRLHTEERPYKCETCGDSFQASTSLRLHILGHTGEKPHACEICDKRFRQRHHLKYHLSGKHNNEQFFHCTLCKNTFNHQDKLKSHMKTHGIGKVVYNCDLCDKTFSRSQSLKGHKSTHTGEKEFTCNLCDKTFGTSQYLRKHKYLHTGN